MHIPAGHLVFDSAEAEGPRSFCLARASSQCGGRAAPEVFATALYTGLRKGELLGLCKADVDLENRLLTVSHSYRRDTTKGGHADVIPIATELVPYLEEAISRSPSALVFPMPDGSMMSDRIQLELVLRRALHKASIVQSWRHRSQRQGCGHVETARDGDVRRCPRCRMNSGRQVRSARFVSTTSAIHYLAAPDARRRRGGGAAESFRHSDPRLATETYGHLVPDYLRTPNRPPVFRATGSSRLIIR